MNMFRTTILSFFIVIIVLLPKVATGASKEANQPVSSSLEHQWQVSPTFSKASLNKIKLFNNKLYITVGSEGTIRTSADGLSWTLNTNILRTNTKELLDIACSDKCVVTVGDAGTILFSQDGLSWTLVKPLTTYPIKRIIYGKNMFIAFSDKPGEVLVSKDGMNWNNYDSGAKNPVNDVICNGKVFVTVGNDGEICTSLNGCNWQIKIIDKKPSFSKIAWSGKIFITLGTTFAETDNFGYTSGIYSAASTNGYSWKINPLSTRKLKKDSNEIYFCGTNEIIWNGKEFLVYQLEQKGYNGFPSSKLITFKTSDGFSYKEVASTVLNDDTCTIMIIYDSCKNYLMVCDNFCRPGFYYGPAIYKSSDGLKWTVSLNENTENVHVKDVVFINGRYIIVGESGFFQYSTDGVNWSSSKQLSLFPMLWDGEKYISIEDKYIYNSDDGFNWSKQGKISESLWLNNAKWDGNNFTWFGNYAFGTFFGTSTDLIKLDMTKFDYNSKVYGDLHSLRAFSTNGSTYVIAGEKGTAISTDKINWKTKIMPNVYEDIIIGNKSYIARNFYGNIDFSSDGLNWKRIHIKDNSIDYSKPIINVTYENALYSIFGSDGSVFQSPDGKNWTRTINGTDKIFQTVVFTGKDYIAKDFNHVYTFKDSEWHQEQLPLDTYNIGLCVSDKRIFVYFNGFIIYKDI